MSTHRLALLAFLCGGCVINGDKWPRPRDLEPSWLVDRPRLLAIRAEPPEIAPGESATFEALMPDPTSDEEPLRVWFACPVLDGPAVGCFPDPELLDPENPDLQALAEAGFIGAEPFEVPTYEAPLDLLDGIEDERDLREGVQVLAQVTALPEGVLQESEIEIDYAEVEAGFKRLLVSEATTPNRNPVIADFVVDRIPVEPGAVVHLEPNQTYDLGIVIDEDTRETYEYLTSEGVVEERVEEPYATWFATGGEVREPATLYPYMESTWLAPEASGESGTWYVVLRDRRGGMTWWVQDWVTD